MIKSKQIEIRIMQVIAKNLKYVKERLIKDKEVAEKSTR